jgi:curved DNA-binding protein
MQFTDYYQTLGVKPDATEAEIKSAYRKLARKFHPDVSKEANAEERFKAVNEANEVLGDKKKRAAYDQVRAGGYRPGEEFRPPPGWGQQGNGPPFDFGEAGEGEGGFSDFFESLFGRARGGAGGARPGAGAQPRQPRRARLDIDLELAFGGGTRRIEIDGRMLDVNIPAGIEPGKSIRLAGQGGNGRDLILEIGYLPHPRFDLDGRNVVVRVAVKPWEAALGARLDVPTLAGNVTMQIPEGSATGRRLRLRGRGMPGPTPGDQYVVIEVHAPKPGSDAQRQAYEALRDAFAPDA